MLELDPEMLDTARVGRLGELVVELELVARGWFAGNFNASMNNSAGWDLFAARVGRSIKIRVKAKRPGIDAFRWSAKPTGEVLLGLDTGDTTDFVAAVSFLRGGGYDVYILPATEVERTLAENHHAYLSQPKRDGGARQDGNQRNLNLNDRLDGSPGHGYRVLWAENRNNWSMLDGAAESS